jgi:hypothetical protein
MAIAAAVRAAATPAASAREEKTAAAVRWSTAVLNKMGTARPVLFCTSMNSTANARRSAVPGCATEILYR